ncbi:MAG: asparaginase [Myxococcota bacterium]|nr:asparaginase [Myxococcota bacterium]
MAVQRTIFNRRVLVIYTGGTIGMKRTPNGYAPASGYMEQQLQTFQAFQDPDAPPRTLPVSQFGGRITYDIIEYDPLLDSSDMEVRHWNQIGKDIVSQYDEYDGFVVLHGTDTMAFTASALSFMLVNLSKPVILTGSQIPLSEVRNDGVNNLLGAMTLAGHFAIPEVCLYFDNVLIRGNRARKIDSSGLGAFRSSNFPNLAEVGVDIKIAWHLIQSMPSRPLKLRPLREQRVAALRLFPGIALDTIERFLQPPLQGLVLETYGAGNVPSLRADFMEVLARATARGLIILNCTQCFSGGVHLDYASGKALAEIGVLSARDMTPEAALTKLAYLLSQDDVAKETCRGLIGKNLRGELTDAHANQRLSIQETAFVEAVAKVIGQGDTFGVSDEVGRVMYPILLCSAASRGDIEALERMIASHANVDVGDYDGRTPLHLAAANGQLDAVRLLLHHGAEVQAADRWGRRPLNDALNGGYDDVAQLIIQHGGQLDDDDVGARLGVAAEVGDLKGLRILLENGAKPDRTNRDGRTPLHRAAAGGQLAAAQLLVRYGASLEVRNRWGQTALDEAAEREHQHVASWLSTMNSSGSPPVERPEENGGTVDIASDSGDHK